MRSTITKNIKVVLFAALLLVVFSVLVRMFVESQFSDSVLAGPPATPTELSSPEKETVEKAKQYLREHATQYSLRSDLSDLQVSRVNTEFDTGVVGFTQLYQGFPVEGIGITVFIYSNPNLPIEVTSTYNPNIIVRNVTPPYPGPNGGTLAPKLTAQEAATRAFAATGAKSRPQSPARTGLVIYPAGKSGKQLVYALAWQVRMTTTDPFGDWEVFLDAVTGEILSKGSHFVPEPTDIGPTPLPRPSPSPSPVKPTLTPIPPTPTPDPSRQPFPTVVPGTIYTVDPSNIRPVLPTPTLDTNRQKQPSTTPSLQATAARIPTTANPAPTTTSNRSPRTPADCSLTMSENFEGAWPTGCWETAGYPTWGTTNFLSHTGSKSAWCAANGVDPYYYDYPNNMNSWMIYGPFDLSRVTWANFHFSYWNRSQLDHDFFRWRVSVDGNIFYHDSNTSRSGNSGGWQDVIFDLTNTPYWGNLTGRSSVWIALTFDSDSDTTDWGTFVDDVWLEVPQANLTPYTPSGWSNPLIPSSIPGIHYVDTLLANGNTYVDWAVVNYGTADTGPFNVGLYLDGSLISEWYVSNLSPWTYALVEDYQMNTPTPGYHWLKLVADSRGDVQESNEGDNLWEYQYYWHAPDLTPYTPPGWDYPIVPSSVQGTNSVGNLYAGRDFYVDWAIINNGDVAANGFWIYLYRDDTLIGWWYVPSLSAGQTFSMQDRQFSGMPALWDYHRLRLVVDSGNAVRELNESNNTWENSFYWWHNLGWVFDPNPVATSGDTTLRDNNNQDSAALTSQLKTVTLQGLDGSGGLKGTYVDLTAAVPPELLGSNCSTGQAYDVGLVYLYTRSDSRFEEVMPYYHIDAIARYLPTLGFTNIITRPIKVFSHCDVTGHYSQSGAIALGRLNVDAGEDAEVIAHEVGHLIQFAQIGDWSQGNSEGGAMGEGFGNYWAASFYNDKNLPVPLTPAPTTLKTCFGDWGYSSILPECNWTVISTKHYPEQMTGEGHQDGQIWSASLWDIWSALGRNTTDRLVLRSHTLLADPPPSARFGEGADAIVRADRDFNGGSNIATITNAFRQRGIFDAFEIDNTSSSATWITPNGASQTHNFHSTSDTDWVKFNATWPNLYLIQTSNLQPNADTVLELYRPDGSTLIASNDDCNIGNPRSCINVGPLTSGTYYIHVRPFGADKTGRNTNYDLSILITGVWTPTNPVYLPLIMK